MPSAHAIISPSSAVRRITCPGSARMEKGAADTAGKDAAEGTAAHFLASTCLATQQAARAHHGRRILVAPDGTTAFTTQWPHDLPGYEFDVDDDMIGHVQTYIDHVRDYVGDGTLFIETEVPIGHITGEPDAFGTSDAIIIRGDELIVIDLKYGSNPNSPETAVGNAQLKLYALGALELYGEFYEFQRVRLVIIQPRRSNAPSEWDCSLKDLQEWARITAAPRLRLAYELHQAVDEEAALSCLTPSTEGCKYCKAKARCPALSAKVQETVGAEFTDLTTSDKVEQEQIATQLVVNAMADLGAKMDAVPILEMFCKAVRGAVEAELLAGRSVAGYKLVEGKRGNREWTDSTGVEEMLKGMRLKKEEMYTFKLISPTQAEKLLKPQQKRWAKLLPLIAQADGKPSVAPVSDSRPPLEIKPVVDEFTNLEEEFV